jgi:hypothetical protein
LNDEIWEVRFNFYGVDNLKKKGRNDITYMNLVALIETLGYGFTDKMYYVKEEGLGVKGMAFLDGMAKVDAMVDQYEQKRCCSITVIRGIDELAASVNVAAIIVEEKLPISEVGVPVVYSVDNDGVLFGSQPSASDSEYMYLCTQ